MAFDWVSYKAGFMAAILLTCMKVSFNRWKRGNSMSVIPFLVQVSYAATILAWEIYWFYLSEKSEGQTTLQVLIIFSLNTLMDTITKLLLLYYVCYRLIILLKISSARSKTIWLSVISFCVAIVLFAEIMFLVPSFDPESFSPATGSILYMLADVAISVAEITVIVKYISYKFGSKNLKELLGHIKDCDLMESFIVTVFMGVASGVLLAIINDIDPDWHLYFICSAIRYNVSCELALVFVEKTVSYSVKKLHDEITVTKKSEKKSEQLTPNSDRPLGPYSFAIDP